MDDHQARVLRVNPRQREVYNRLYEIQLKGGKAPTAVELAKEFGVSAQAMARNIRTLKEVGLIKRGKKPRSIEVTPPPLKANEIPLLGRIAAGQPLEAIESDRTVEIPESMTPDGEVYALEVDGESMIDDGIRDGDVVVVRRQSMAYDGQTVVGVINGEATLKRYYHEGDRIRLQPANENLKPFYAGPDDDFEIRGVVHALYRTYPTIK